MCWCGRSRESTWDCTGHAGTLLITVAILTCTQSLFRSISSGHDIKSFSATLHYHLLSYSTLLHLFDVNAVRSLDLRVSGAVYYLIAYIQSSNVWWKDQMINCLRYPYTLGWRHTSWCDHVHIPFEGLWNQWLWRHCGASRGNIRSNAAEDESLFEHSGAYRTHIPKVDAGSCQSPWGTGGYR